MKQISSILLGIGNVGLQYEGTRHNIGFDIVDLLVERANTVTQRSFKFSTVFECSFESTKLALIKPTTLVNLSGYAGAEAMDVYGLSVEQMLVAVDDFHLALGTIRFRGKGSSGGHNGLKSLIEHCGSTFARLRFGIGPLPENDSIIDFVLGKFSEEQHKVYLPALETATQAVLCYFREGLTETMNQFNS